MGADAVTPLEQLHADQHDDVLTASDHQFEAFLDEVNPDVAFLDLAPRTAIESLHLSRIRRTA